MSFTCINTHHWIWNTVKNIFYAIKAKKIPSSYIFVVANTVPIRKTGDHFAKVVKSSYTQFCTLKSILILNSDLEYVYPRGAWKLSTPWRVGGTLSLVCDRNSVLSNMALHICILIFLFKNMFCLMMNFLKELFIPRRQRTNNY